MKKHLCIPGILLVFFVLTGSLQAHAGALSGSIPRKISYDRQVRAIFASHCILCHGNDAGQRMAGLRLDDPAVSEHPLSSGATAIVPFHPEKSEILQRIADHGGMRMPPQGSGVRVTAEEVKTLTAWIRQGAHYQPHWAYVAPHASALPQVNSAAWNQNPIDRFVLARLQRHHLAPAQPAQRSTLVRRVWLEVTGLPPTLHETNLYLHDKKPGAALRMINRALASPHYGERMAVNWLDLARYADTNGYSIDNARTMWPWRNWVINAFNANMPYNQFVIKQLAGDLLPHATLADKIASGFNRNNAINFEGGAIPEQYAAAYVEDRVDTTATTFLGLTMKCGQCHSHKYDPISHTEYYRFYAFFNDVPENGLDGAQGNAQPYIQAPTPRQQRDMNQISADIKNLKTWAASADSAQQTAETAWVQQGRAVRVLAQPPHNPYLLACLPLQQTSGLYAQNNAPGNHQGVVLNGALWQGVRGMRFNGKNSINLGKICNYGRNSRFSYGAWVKPSAAADMDVVSHMNDAQDFRGWDMFLLGGKVFIHIIHKWPVNALKIESQTALPMNQWSHVFATYDGSGKAQGIHLYFNGKPAAVTIDNNNLSASIRNNLPVAIGRRSASSYFQGSMRDLEIYSAALSPWQVSHLYHKGLALYALQTGHSTPVAAAALKTLYSEAHVPGFEAKEVQLDRQQQRQVVLNAQIPTTMVMEDMKPRRVTHILIRGQFDHLGAAVTPGTPAFLPAMPSGAPDNRLGLAEWMVMPSNPLTARVEVNRIWQMMFGTGIVKTCEDFGDQGALPSNQPLLDWLAVHFEQSGWNIKALIRLILTSQTFRQSSRTSSRTYEIDPDNQLLAHGPRFRMAGEFIRDQALALGGLLNPAIGGPSVESYQPKGLWSAIAFGGGYTAQKYQQVHGAALYRRSLYLFWKRAAPPPELETFDAPTRDYCTVTRTITNTPLQSLLLFNDTTFVECARGLAQSAMLQGGSTTSSRLQYLYRRVLCRAPRPQEMRALLPLLRAAGAYYAAHPHRVQKLLAIGESIPDPNLSPARLAAWTTVCSALLNLDETISIE